jgi:hypothetical protein
VCCDPEDEVGYLSRGGFVSGRGRFWGRETFVAEVGWRGWQIGEFAKSS